MAADGLTGDQIPPEAAIISACDGWDAMTSARPYRSALQHDSARQNLLEGAGTQWDHRAVELLLDELDQNGPVDTRVFHSVGRDQNTPSHDHVCTDALPDHLRPRETRRAISLNPSPLH